MAKKFITEGTKVRCRHNGGEISVAHIESIEKCKCGEKYGSMVAKVDFEKRGINYAKNYQYIISLDNNKWCYGEQVLAIVED
jgi:hypothetical protein